MSTYFASHSLFHENLFGLFVSYPKWHRGDRYQNIISGWTGKLIRFVYLSVKLGVVIFSANVHSGQRQLSALFEASLEFKHILSRVLYIHFWEYILSGLFVIVCRQVVVNYRAARASMN